MKKTPAACAVIALAGNPNVGKSTVFNALTGMRQHTGNWPGKTVAIAEGTYEANGRRHRLVDLPGTYALMAHSAEEQVAQDFLTEENPDCTVVVADATCLERNLHLVLQLTELSPRVVLCLNLMDEAQKKGIRIDIIRLSEMLGVPVVPCTARAKKGLQQLIQTVDRVVEGKVRCAPPPICYTKELRNMGVGDSNSSDGAAHSCQISACVLERAEEIARETVHTRTEDCHRRDRRLDRVLIGRYTGVPCMLLLLVCVLFLTIKGANVPSAFLSDALFSISKPLGRALHALHLPDVGVSLLVDGVWKTLAWVVSVMLPPMAIFFPLFTLLEDLGYLPRVAFNLDGCFARAHACGKQALTMCMGLGCNACGVAGCRIIDSPRERLLAMLTNALTPCNGRFPTLIALATIFFSAQHSVVAALIVCGVIVCGVLLTLLVSRILSGTLLRGLPSSFTLELPPYRAPQVGWVIVRSLLDRTVFVLARAAVVAAPAGLVIWLMGNCTVGTQTVLQLCAAYLDGFARVFGMDGVILLAFLLGFPANEIVLPLILMGYTAGGSLMGYDSLASLHALLTANGWTPVTALCVMLFSLAHWPCSTTCLTLHRETGSLRWTIAGMLIPTAVGLIICFCVAAVGRWLGVA